MADRADERLKALKASMKEALGKLTGSDELEAQGVRERTDGSVGRAAGAPSAARVKQATASGEARRPSRRRS